MNGSVWIEDGALLFDGVDDYVQVPHSASLTFENEITVSAWVNLNDFSDWWTKIVIKPHTEYAGPWEMFTLDLSRMAPYPRFIITDGIEGGDSASVANSEVLLNMNQWYHIVGTYDGSTIALYLDGQLIDSKPADIPIGNNDMPICVGGRLGVESVDGYIKDVRIYRRGLNQIKVQSLYQNQ